MNVYAQFRRVSSPRIFLLSLAAASLIGGSVVPAQNAMAAAPTAPAAVSSAAIKVSTKSIIRTGDAYKAVLYIPVISGMTDTSYQQKLNQTLENNALKSLHVIRKQAADDLAQSKKGGYPFHKHELKLQFAANKGSSLSEGGFISLKLHTYMYTGGAHGISNIETYNIANGKKASDITLKSIFGSSYASIVDKEIRQQIKAKPEQYFKDGFTGVKANQPFYIQNGSVQVVFQPYEIAPYATGIPEFKLPLPKADPDPSMKVTINGKALDGITVTRNKEGIAMIPVRGPAEALGYQLTWSTAKNTLELQKGDSWTSVTIDSDSYSSNNSAPVSLGSAPVLDKQGRLTVPLALFTEILKAKAEYSSSGDKVDLHA